MLWFESRDACANPCRGIIHPCAEFGTFATDSRSQFMCRSRTCPAAKAACETKAARYAKAGFVNALRPKLPSMVPHILFTPMTARVPRFGDRLVARLPDLALLAMAHGALRVLRPLRAHAVMMRVGALLPRLETAEEVRRVARSLGRHGSCLSRALVVASRAHTADVVIGVERRSKEQLVAHAWVEMDGSPIHPSEVTGKTIVRLRNTRLG
jgi:hypothetical protein